MKKYIGIGAMILGVCILGYVVYLHQPRKWAEEKVERIVLPAVVIAVAVPSAGAGAARIRPVRIPRPISSEKSATVREPVLREYVSQPYLEDD